MGAQHRMKALTLGTRLLLPLAAAAALVVIMACASAQSRTATWYGEPYHGRPTASGETFDMHALTAAHHSLAFGTLVRVTNPSNGRSVVVRINDRVPRRSRCAIDLSREAFSRIAPLQQGRVPVEIEVLSAP
ncbi:MAG: hypothetical protein Kow0059_22760 [Candidatus Sumerlaeia bacterium]